jgi:L-malate glycosyltransferase
LNIIILTSLYPANDLPKGLTPVVHFFAKEWVKKGHTVRVVHNHTIFPKFYYWFARKFNGFISNFVGSTIPKFRRDTRVDYEIDGVKVIRLPILKKIPFFNYSEKVQQKQFLSICEILESEIIKPDFVIGHWITPQLGILSKLKDKYNYRTILVIHEVSVEIIQNYYKKSHLIYLNSIDKIGYRSKSIRKQFEGKYGMYNKGFDCFSGLPIELLDYPKNKIFLNELKSITFIGSLIKRKHPDKILKAVNDLDNKRDIEVNYLGVGPLENQLKKLSFKFGITEMVKFHGYRKRKFVKDILNVSDCFVMISEKEAFGLVYLEALSSGCLTIVSKNEGFDGIIIDGFNGFLCSSGDYQELNLIFRKINSMTISEKYAISKNAILTVANFTSENVAELYLKNIIE